jgi:hypothetical protein
MSEADKLKERIVGGELVTNATGEDLERMAREMNRALDLIDMGYITLPEPPKEIAAQKPSHLKLVS